MAKKNADLEPVEFGKNLAGNKKLADLFMENVGETMQLTRNNRSSREEIWLEDLKQWSCRLTDTGYVGFSNIFVPELHNQIESSVEKTIAALFPHSDFLQCIPMRGNSKERADKIKMAVLYDLESKNMLSSKYATFERQKVLYGTSLFKGSYEKKIATIFTREPGSKKPIEKKVPTWNGTKWDVVDLFHWYIYPETSELDTCEMTFEDRFVKKQVMEESGMYMNMDAITEVPQQYQNSWVDCERLDILRLPQAINIHKKAILLTEVWTQMMIGGALTPVTGIIANYRTVVRLLKNPYWFQHNPYAASRYLRRPGNIFYGYSLPDRIRTQGHQMNDLANHTMDSLNYALNPIIVIDPALAGDVNSMKVHPGAKWLGAIDGVKPMAFPDISGSGWKGMQEVRGQIAQFSDNTPGIAPQLQGKSRSATQASLVNNAVSIRQRVQGRQQEAEVLAPIAQMTHTMLQQFRDEAYEVRMRGPDNGDWIVEQIDPSEDLAGYVEFAWVGASEEEKNAVRSQQLIAMFQASLQMASLLPPGEVDLQSLFKRVAKEAFQIHDLEEIFKSMRDKKTVSPKIENIALGESQDLLVNYGDDDEDHMKVHGEILKDKKASDEVKLATIRHNERHQIQAKAKADKARMEARLQAFQATAQAQQGQEGQQGHDGGPDQRQTPQPPGIGEGNMQQAMSSPANVFTSAKGTFGQ